MRTSTASLSFETVRFWRSSMSSNSRRWVLRRVEMQGKYEEGPPLLAVLEAAGVDDFGSVVIMGAGVRDSGRLKLQREQIDDDVLLDIANRGTCKIAGPDIAWRGPRARHHRDRGAVSSPDTANGVSSCGGRTAAVVHHARGRLGRARLGAGDSVEGRLQDAHPRARSLGRHLDGTLRGRPGAYPQARRGPDDRSGVRDPRHGAQSREHRVCSWA